MKQMKYILLMAVASVLFFTACQKSSDAGAVSIVGKWRAVNSINWYTVNGTTIKDTVTYLSEEYADFRKDRKCYLSYSDIFSNASGTHQYNKDTAAYTVYESLLYITYGYGTNTYQVQTLTPTQLTIYNKTVDVRNGVNEYWSNFRR